MNEIEHDGPGRPSKYKEEYVEQVFRLALLGLKDDEISSYFEVDKVTFYRWQEQHPEFRNSVKEGKVEANGKVAAAFYKRAIGMTVIENTFEKIQLEEPKTTDTGVTDSAFKVTTKVKEIMPDPGACLNWLKNREPERWRDKHEIDHTTNGKSIESSITLSNGTKLAID